LPPHDIGCAGNIHRGGDPLHNMHVSGQILRVFLHEPHYRYGGFLSKQIPPTKTQSAFDSAFSGWGFIGKKPSEIKTEFWLWCQERTHTGEVTYWDKLRIPNAEILRTRTRILGPNLIGGSSPLWL